MAIQFLNTVQVDTSVLYVDTANDRVGIGTTSPSTKLHVIGNLRAGAAADYVELTTSGNVVFSDGTSAILPTTSTTQTLNIGGPIGSASWNTISHQFSNEAVWNPGILGAMDAMNLSNLGDLLIKGNVGIGTTNPASQLGSARVLDISSTGNGEVILDHTDAGSSSDIGLYSWNRNNDHLAHIKATCDGATDSAFISFHAQATGGSFSGPGSNERMRIESNGNVGIGTTSPPSKLSVSGGTLSVSGSGAGFGVVKLGDPTDSNPYVGIYRSAAAAIATSGNFLNLGGYDGIAFTTGAAQLSGQSERMRILQNGNVGIGTTSPSSILHLESSEPTLKIKSSGYYNTSAIEMGNGANATAGVITCNNNPGFYALELKYDNGSAGDARMRVGLRNLDFLIDAGSAMYINSSKNVGIGTTSPTRALDVSRSGSTILANFNNTGGTTSFISLGNTSSTADQIRLGSNGTALTLSTSYTEKMRIDSSGNVGIGTTTPSVELQVGDFGGTETPEIIVAGGTSSQIQLRTTNATGSFAQVGFGGSQFANSNTAGKIKYTHTSQTSPWLDVMSFRVNYSDRMIINGSGNVGIGTTSPGEKLEVDGNVKADNYINQRVAWNVGFNHGSNNAASYYYIPVGYLAETTADTYYNNWIAPYAGRVRKIVLRNTGQSTVPTATTVNFRVSVNGSVVHTGSTITVTGSGLNILASETLSDSTAVFNATDRVQVAYRTNGFWRNVAAGISLEYTE